MRTERAGLRTWCLWLFPQLRGGDAGAITASGRVCQCLAAPILPGGGGSQDRPPVRGGGAGRRAGPRRRRGAADRRADRGGGRRGAPGAGRRATVRRGRRCSPQEQQIRDWIERDELQLTNIHGKLARRGVVVPYRTLHRFAVERCGFGRRQPDGAGRRRRAGGGVPGRLRPARADPRSGRGAAAGAARVDLHRGVLAAHVRVVVVHARRWPTVIAGCEAAWGFFGGVFKVLIPDNLNPVVADADPVNPTFTVGLAGLRPGPRVRHRPGPGPFARRTSRGWSGSCSTCAATSSPARRSLDLADAQRRVEAWCATTAGLRVHGTTASGPAELFAADEQPLLLPVPGRAATTCRSSPPRRSPADQHVEVARGALLGAGRADRAARARSAPTPGW